MRVSWLLQVDGQVAGRLLNAMTNPGRKGSTPAFAGRGNDGSCAVPTAEGLLPQHCHTRDACLDALVPPAPERPVRLPWSQPEDARFVCDVMAGEFLPCPDGPHLLTGSALVDSIASSPVRRHMSCHSRECFRFGSNLEWDRPVQRDWHGSCACAA